MYFKPHKTTHAIITSPLFLVFILISTQLCSCGRAPQQEVSSKKTPPKKVIGCQGCHSVKIDKSHAFSCIICHQGDNQTSNKDKAHAKAIAAPAYPTTMSICGKCHDEIVKSVSTSSHFTLKHAVNTVRRAFGAGEISSLLEIPQVSKPLKSLNLADDLLRRRCLRCHPYYAGDPYPATRHGKGCAACHIAYKNSKPISHEFIVPTDKQCLSCHYGNFVGADYYGHFEHDFNWEYRTPFSEIDDDITARPYGIRFQQLTPDIHQLSGMICVDCHLGAELMGSDIEKITCAACHLYRSNDHPQNIEPTDGKIWLTTKGGKKLAVPQAVDTAHKYISIAACQVCHAQWSFNDQGTYLIRQDSDGFDEWLALTRQGDFEVERELEASLFNDDDSDEPQQYDNDRMWMSDKISRESKPGIWLKSYKLRRWEPVQICRDKNGVLQVCRNIMDLHLSYVNEEDEVVFDNITPDKKSALPLPYTPHTTGKAGAFYKLRLNLSTLRLRSATGQ